MQIYRDIDSLRHYLKSNKNKKSIGLVPTMGALHQGHLSLVEASKKENDITVCSIFVNPRQFNNTEDLKRYPRTLERDVEMLESINCDVLFFPDEEEIYNQKEPQIQISFGYLESIMEGKYRPGHFNGVGLIVTKLFNIVDPDAAYFGQKDLQQFVIIKHLVEELNFSILLNCIPIKREADGLAMSSRNIRLSDKGRKDAVVFYSALKMAKELIMDKRDIAEVKAAVYDMFADHETANLEYFEIVNAQSLRPSNKIEGEDITALCIAGYIDGVRLIDNLII